VFGDELAQLFVVFAGPFGLGVVVAVEGDDASDDGRAIAAGEEFDDLEDEFGEVLVFAFEGDVFFDQGLEPFFRPLFALFG
jgi:hypothetical protein